MSKIIILVSIIIVLSTSFIFYASLYPPSQSEIQLGVNSEIFASNQYQPVMFGSWDPVTAAIGLSWQSIPDATYRLEKRVDGGEWITILNNYTEVHYNDFKVLPSHTYQYRLFAVSQGDETFIVDSNQVFTAPRSQKLNPYTNIPIPLQQVSPVIANVPFYELHLNETQSRATPVYFNCEQSGGDCRVMVNRKLDTAGEYLFGYKNGTEVFAIMERYNGTLALVQRVNPETSAYTMQINPSGQIIMWYPLYLLSEDNYWGRIMPFNNGTVKFVLEDPPFPTCVKC